MEAKCLFTVSHLVKVVVCSAPNSMSTSDKPVTSMKVLFLLQEEEENKKIEFQHWDALDVKKSKNEANCLSTHFLAVEEEDGCSLWNRATCRLGVLDGVDWNRGLRSAKEISNYLNTAFNNCKETIHVLAYLLGATGETSSELISSNRLFFEMPSGVETELCRWSKNSANSLLVLLLYPARSFLLFQSVNTDSRSQTFTNFSLRFGRGIIHSKSWRNISKTQQKGKKGNCRLWKYFDTT